MKTIVVAFNNKDHVNNFENIHTRYGDVRIITHEDPVSYATPTGIYRNYDLLIHSQTEHTQVAVTDPERTVVMTRYGKDRINGMLIEFANNNGLDKFHRRAVWSNDVAMQHSEIDYFKFPRYVIKTTYGARGIGQFIVTPGEGETVRHVYKHFSSFIVKIAPELNELSQANHDPNNPTTSVEAKVKLNDIIARNMTFNGSFTNFEPADTSFLIKQLSNINSWCFEEFVEDIVEEWRVLTGVTRNVFLQRQIKNDGPFPMAIGSLEVQKAVNRITSIDDHTNKQLEAILYKHVPTNSSVDVYILKNGRFGIFEHCAQFGTLGVKSEIVKSLHQSFIENRYKQMVESK